MPSQETDINVAFDRDQFINMFMGELADVLQQIAGDNDAAGIISIVAKHLGELLSYEYRKGFQVNELNVEQIAHTLVDLKRRIDGDFYIVSIDPEKIVLKNRRCPLGRNVVGRPSLCMMTSNVFGVIASDNLGYAKVELLDTIARGGKECEVIVYLQQNHAAEKSSGKEYLKNR